MTPIRSRVVDSPIGPLTLAGDTTLTHLRMDDQTHPPSGQSSWSRDDRAFPDVVEQLDAYFEGTLDEFDVDLDLRGSDFHVRVWQALRDIPYAETWSYGDLADHIGAPGAARAVGAANGRNPIAIIVPCHRVIGASGALTGYGGGIERKRFLLELESGARTPRLDFA
jgi:methylated-DNA-[protein]-cysteine S-methyltransferase